MNDQEKKSLYYALVFITLLGAILLMADFLLRMDSYPSSLTGFRNLDLSFREMIIQTRPDILYIRAGFVLSLAGIAFLRPKRIATSGKVVHLLVLFCSLMAITLFIYGYTGYFYYNVVVYPVLFLLLFILIPEGLGIMAYIFSPEEKTLNRVNSRKEEFSFKYHTDKGKLYIHDIRTATFIEGSAKAGKTASLIIPTIVQAAEKGFAGLIYDYEGDLNEPGGGLLSSVAYTALQNSGSAVRFAIINFTDLSRTVRCNPFDPRYIRSYNHAQEIATVIMYNINRIWSRNKDFWAENAIAAYAAAIWFFCRNHPRMSTIPHITEFMLNDFRQVLAVLKTDEDVAPYIRPILAAMDRNAYGQIAGAESSTQFPLSRMRSPEVYYVFNPEPGMAFNLDITSPQNPHMLCVCNSSELHNSLAPAIGAVIQVCRVQMNKLGKHRSIFLFDEMPTVYIDKMDKIPAEARKKQVCAFFAVQTYDQLVRDYGSENARVIRNSCGNIITGIAGMESADLISRMMGEAKRPFLSSTTGDSGTSFTRSMKEEKVLKASTVAAQPTGHFSGRILGGDPPYFSAGFKYRPFRVNEIPRFNYPVEIDDHQLQEKILAATVKENYMRVKNEVKSFMNSFSHLFTQNQ